LLWDRKTKHPDLLSQAEEKKKEQTPPEKKPSGAVSSSPFQVWAKEHRALVREETGGKLTAQELAKELARRWKALDKQEKSSYKVGRQHGWMNYKDTEPYMSAFL
jgi:hypothetical protein